MKLNDAQTENVLNAIALAAMVQIREDDLHADGEDGEMPTLYKNLIQPGLHDDPWQDLAWGASMLTQGLLNLVTGLLSYLRDECNTDPTELLGLISRSILSGEDW